MNYSQTLPEPTYSTHLPSFCARAYSSCSQRAIKPPMTPPTIGATQNSQSDPSATPPPKMAVAVERAGFTDALSTGMATRWMKVSVNPMAIGAKPTGLSATSR